MTLDIDTLRSWIGRTQDGDATIDVVPLEGLAATLDEPRRFVSGDAVPPLWHWLYFLPQASQADLGEDGHPARGGFLPPVPLPRRMWAGSSLDFRHPLRVGQDVTRRSEISGVELKEGAEGPLVFVRVRHTLSSGDVVAIVEDQDIVYRGDPAKAGNGGPPAAAARTEVAPASRFAERIVPSAALLFRYSALTFNAHRIHYDRPYAQGVEGYPGLVVHGPLTATLLVGAACRASPGRTVRRFAFRARRPIFDTAPFTIEGSMTDADRAELRAGADGAICTTASIVFEGGAA